MCGWTLCTSVRMKMKEMQLWHHLVLYMTLFWETVLGCQCTWFGVRAAWVKSKEPQVWASEQQPLTGTNQQPPEEEPLWWWWRLRDHVRPLRLHFLVQLPHESAPRIKSDVTLFEALLYNTQGGLQYLRDERAFIWFKKKEKKRNSQGGQFTLAELGLNCSVVSIWFTDPENCQLKRLTWEPSICKKGWLINWKIPNPYWSLITCCIRSH